HPCLTQILKEHHIKPSYIDLLTCWKFDGPKNPTIQIYTRAQNHKQWWNIAREIHGLFPQDLGQDLQIELLHDDYIHHHTFADPVELQDLTVFEFKVPDLRRFFHRYLGDDHEAFGIYVCGDKPSKPTPLRTTLIIYIKPNVRRDWATLITCTKDILSTDRIAIRLQTAQILPVNQHSEKTSKELSQLRESLGRKLRSGDGVSIQGVDGKSSDGTAGLLVLLEKTSPPEKYLCVLTNNHVISPPNQTLREKAAIEGISLSKDEENGLGQKVWYPPREKLKAWSDFNQAIIDENKELLGSNILMRIANPVLFRTNQTKRIQKAQAEMKLINRLLLQPNFGQVLASSGLRKCLIASHRMIPHCGCDDHFYRDWALIHVTRPHQIESSFNIAPSELEIDSRVKKGGTFAFGENYEVTRIDPLGDTVQYLCKRGSATGVTTGRYTPPGVWVYIPSQYFPTSNHEDDSSKPEVYFLAYEVVSLDENRIVAPGDSGSIFVNEFGNAVGLTHGEIIQGGNDKGRRALMLPLTDIKTDIERHTGYKMSIAIESAVSSWDRFLSRLYPSNDHSNFDKP
ncbi:MAG: hypothetical protein Q9187_004199, partial [Circinaria calcarea]